MGPQKEVLELCSVAIPVLECVLGKFSISSPKILRFDLNTLFGHIDVSD